MAAETPTHSFWKSDQVQSLVSTLMYGVGGSLGYTIANLGLEGLASLPGACLSTLGVISSSALLIGGYKRPLHYFLSTLLGAISGVGLFVAFNSEQFWTFGAYTAALGFFHCSEYIVTAYYNYPSLSVDSFLINHSRAYHAAALLSWTEYALEMRFAPWLVCGPVSQIGLALTISGEVVRKLAMITAGSNFKHLVATQKEEDHQLVRSGIYRLCRHPSYAGWFYWAVGTQLLLCNPVSTVAYGYAAYTFFKERIYAEEYHLLLFFREQYATFQDEVPTGVPFVPGYPNKDFREWLRIRREHGKVD